MQTSEDEEQCHKRFTDRHPFTAIEGQMPSDHHFISVEVEGTQRCDICHKKIWALKSRVQECQNCGLKCHKKCSRYCELEVPCYKHHLQHGESLVLESLRLTQDGDAEVYGSDDEDSDTELGDGHRHLEQLTHTSSEEPEANSETIVSGLACKEDPRDTRHMDKVRADPEDEERRMKECNLEPNTYEDNDHYQHKASESDPEQAVTDELGFQYEDMEQRRALEEV